MNFQAKTVAVALAALLTVVGGAAAVSGGTGALTDAGAAASGDVNVATTYTNGTVTVEVTQNGSAVEGAAIEVAGEEYTTDANGTVTAEDVEVESGDELDVELEADGVEAELSYVLQDGELTLLEEEYEYEQAADTAETEEADEETEDVDEETEETDEEPEDVDEETDDAEEPEDDETEEADDEEDDADD